MQIPKYYHSASYPHPFLCKRFYIGNKKYIKKGGKSIMWKKKTRKEDRKRGTENNRKYSYI